MNLKQLGNYFLSLLIIGAVYYVICIMFNQEMTSEGYISIMASLALLRTFKEE